MSEINIVLYAVLWVFFGVVAYGGVYAECINQHSEHMDRSCAVFRVMAGLLGPLGFISVALATGFFKNGLRFR